jgi:hypothetical protein
MVGYPCIHIAEYLAERQEWVAACRMGTTPGGRLGRWW